jgi:hypothetical protein
VGYLANLENISNKILQKHIGFIKKKDAYFGRMGDIAFIMDFW